MIRAVLFDFYDTLAYIEGAGVSASRRHIAQTCGVSVEQFDAQWRGSLASRTLGTLPCLEDELASMLLALEIEQPRELLRELAEQDHAAWVAGVYLYDGALATLAALRGCGHLLGLVSNCSNQTGRVLQALDFHQHVDACALSFELGIAKPDPGIYLAACDRLQVTPSEAIFVADGAGGELDTAHDLGMLTVLVEHPDGRRPKVGSRHHDVRIEALAELLALPIFKPT